MTVPETYVVVFPDKSEKFIQTCNGAPTAACTAVELSNYRADPKDPKPINVETWAIRAEDGNLVRRYRMVHTILPLFTSESIPESELSFGDAVRKLTNQINELIGKTTDKDARRIMRLASEAMSIVGVMEDRKSLAAGDKQRG